MSSWGRTLVLVCCLTLFVATPVLSQSVSLRAGAGGLVLTRPNDLDTFLGSGTDLMLDLSLQPFSASFPGFEISTIGTFDRFTTNESDLLIFFPRVQNQVDDIDNGDLSFFTGSLGLRYTIVNADIPSKPYVTAGIGMYHYRYRPGTFLDENGNIVTDSFDGTVFTLDGDEVISTALGWNAGVGLDFSVNDTYGFFVEAQYVVVRNGEYGQAITTIRSVETEDVTRYYPVRFGVTIRLATFGAAAAASTSPAE